MSIPVVRAADTPHKHCGGSAKREERRESVTKRGECQLITFRCLPFDIFMARTI